MIRSELDVLLDKVEDSALRADLRRQIERLTQRRSFGLVFEQHIPERVRLPQHPIRVGSQVVTRDDEDSPTFEVVAIEDGLATLELVRGADGAYVPRGEHPAGERERMAQEALVAITDFGEPVLPGLRYLGAVERGGDKPYHVVINAENHHALEALRFTHAGKVDCIYIDPPYNSGARDWKYNNDYVDETDAYRHSKWLAFMERRLKLAKELLNPDDSVLIVTIDEREYLRLGLLLEQTFVESRIQMVSSVIKAEGTSRADEFSRTNEFLFFVRIGTSPIFPLVNESEEVEIPWRTLRRTDYESRRGTAKGGPAQFYAIFVNNDAATIQHVGEPLPHAAPRTSVPDIDGCTAVFPVRPDGTEMNWSLTRESLLERMRAGYVRVGRFEPTSPQQYVISYLKSGAIEDIKSGAAEVIGRNSDGSIRAVYRSGKLRMPTTQWAVTSHDAQRGGTGVLRALLGPTRRFPFPKSVYAVEDTIRFFVKDKHDAVVLDFFAGSGTTAHAVMRLNKQDGGRRQSIMLTNNEVSVDEAGGLRARGHRPGDPEWEALGIFEHITRPRVTAAITGRTPEGEPIKGDYKFTDEFPMADGFEENAAFLELRYLDADDVDLGLAYDDIAPLLWLRAGATGPIAKRTDDAAIRLPYAWTDKYGALFDEDKWRAFASDCPPTATAAFILTNSPTTFAGIVAELPTDADTVRLYDSYLSMFQAERGRA
jgi:adenine-specific DNA-methyltransferase